MSTGYRSEAARPDAARGPRAVLRRSRASRNAEFVKRRITPFTRVAPGWGGSFAPVPGPGYDLVHTWNSVPVLTAGRS